MSDKGYFQDLEEIKSPMSPFSSGDLGQRPILGKAKSTFSGLKYNESIDLTDEYPSDEELENQDIGRNNTATWGEIVESKDEIGKSIMPERSVINLDPSDDL